MAEVRIYQIGKNRLNRSRFTNMSLEENQVFKFVRDKQIHTLLLPALIREDEGSGWGRLHLEYEIEEECVCTVWASANYTRELEEKLFSDETQESERKRIFQQTGKLCGVNCKDMLLNNLKGKYLWIYIEISGMGNGKLSNIWVKNPADSFLDTFPEIYREEESFFQRYLSIFSSLYQDFQSEIDMVYQNLDFDLAPRELLNKYASWLGLKLDGDFLDENLLRSLLKNLYTLNKKKGTKGALLLLIQLVLQKKAIVVERGLMLSRLSEEERWVYNRLYGESKLDITILVNHEEQEMIKSQLLFLMNQYKPARTHIRLIFYGNSSRMDSYCYMDLNAQIYQPPQTIMDSGRMLEEYRFQS